MKDPLIFLVLAACGAPANRALPSASPQSASAGSANAASADVAEQSEGQAPGPPTIDVATLAKGAPVTIAPRSHTILCTAMWVMHADTLDRDILGCPTSPAPLRPDDQPCRIREGIDGKIVSTITYDKAGRLATFERSTEDGARHELSYDQRGRLERMKMPERRYIELSYENGYVDHDEIAGLSWRRRYIFVKGRVSKVEAYNGDLMSSPKMEHESTHTLVYRGDAVVGSERDHVNTNWWGRTHTTWENGRPTRVDWETGEGDKRLYRGTDVFAYDDRGRPTKIDDAQLDYDCQ